MDCEYTRTPSLLGEKLPLLLECEVTDPVVTKVTLLLASKPWMVSTKKSGSVPSGPPNFFENMSPSRIDSAV